MRREDLIEDITETYPAREPAGAERTAFQHCTRGPVASEPEAVRRALDERIAAAVLARGLAISLAPSFIQLLAMLPGRGFASGTLLALVATGGGYARTLLADWPQRPRLTVALLMLVYLLFGMTTWYEDPAAGHVCVLLPAILALNWFANSLAREVARWGTSYLLLDEAEAARVRAGCDRLTVPEGRILIALSRLLRRLHVR
jgi:hypothetical protein